MAFISFPEILLAVPWQISSSDLNYVLNNYCWLPFSNVADWGNSCSFCFVVTHYLHFQSWQLFVAACCRSTGKILKTLVKFQLTAQVSSKCFGWCHYFYFTGSYSLKAVVSELSLCFYFNHWIWGWVLRLVVKKVFLELLFSKLWYRYYFFVKKIRISLKNIVKISSCFTFMKRKLVWSHELNVLLLFH